MSQSLFSVLRDRIAAVKHPVELIFDFDGTVATLPVDWRGQRALFHQHLIQLGVVLPEIRRIDEMELEALEKHVDLSERILAFRSELEASAAPSVVIPDTLAILTTRENPIANCRAHIISNNLRSTVERELARFNLRSRFSSVYGLDDTRKPKPATNAGLLLQSIHKINFSNCIMLGDSDHTDGEFCSRLGISYINITNVSPK